MILAQAKTEEIVRTIFLKDLKLLSIIRYPHQKLLLVNLKRNVLTNPSLYIDGAIIVLTIICWLLSGLFLDAAVHLSELEVFVC